MSSESETTVDSGTDSEGPADQSIPAVEVDDSPAPVSAALALVAAAVGAVMATAAVPLAGAAGVLGLVLVAAGVVRGRVTAVILGSVGLLVGALLAGMGSAGITPVLGIVLTAALAWDLGEQAINVGEQMGRESPTARGELVHAGLSLAVGLAAAGIAATIYVAAAGGLPTVALVVLVVAAVLLTAALRP